jgi:hypothetical protein
MNQQQSSIHSLFKRCGSCGEELEEGALFLLGIPLCLPCHLTDKLKLRTIVKEKVSP